MIDKTCFCCGAEMKKYETDRNIFYYCFKCSKEPEGKKVWNTHSNMPIEEFASEYENNISN